jgi:phosphate-selective porin OprO/OprP
MKGIKVKNPFDFEKGTGKGAFELGFRYEYLGIDDVKISQGTKADTRLRGAFDCGVDTRDTYGGSGVAVGNASACDLETHQYTVGLKWIANPNVLAKVSLTYSDYGHGLMAPDTPDKGASGETFDSETLLQTRVQWMF